MERTDRADKIAQIVREEYDKMWAETDRHGTLTGDRWDECMCGWAAPLTSKNRKVSVGVHVSMAKRKAEKIRAGETKRRMAEIS